MGSVQRGPGRQHGNCLKDEGASPRAGQGARRATLWEQGGRERQERKTCSQQCGGRGRTQGRLPGVLLRRGEVTPFTKSGS